LFSSAFVIGAIKRTMPIIIKTVREIEIDKDFFIKIINNIFDYK